MWRKSLGNSTGQQLWLKNSERIRVESWAAIAVTQGHLSLPPPHRACVAPIAPVTPCVLFVTERTICPGDSGVIYIFFFCMCVHYPRTFNCRPARFPFSLIPHSNASRGGWGDGGGEGQSLLPTPPPTFHSLYTMAGSANQLSLPGRH